MLVVHPGQCQDRGSLAEIAPTYSGAVAFPSRRKWTMRAVVAVVTFAVFPWAGVSSAVAARDVVTGATNYGRAATALSQEVVLWRPTYTAALRRKGPIDVIAYGKDRKRSTFVGSTYGKRVPSFTLAQKSSDTNWAATPVEYANQGLVASVPIRIGAPGSKRQVRARVYANCRVPGAQERSCTRTDVARFGGTLEILARTMVDGVPQATNIRLDSNGLSYRQLVRVARGLVPAT